MPSKIEALAKEAIGGKVFPGCVVGIVNKNGERHVWPFGTIIYDNDSRRTREDTIYDVASITKSIPTASLALTLIAEGRLRSTNRVVAYLPELQNDYGATVTNLLTYRVRGTQLSALKEKSSDEIIQHVFSHGFDGPVGESNYTNLPAFLLGLIVERVGGDTLDALAQQYFFGPFAMKDTSFFPTDVSRIPPTEIVDGTEIRGIVHDESARVFARARKAVGHAGLFSTAGDILNFLEALLRSDLKEVADGAQRGWGWQVDDSRFMGKYSSPYTFGKTGFTGTSIVCDIERGIAFVILSNRTYPKRPTDDFAVFKFRADITDIIFGSAV